MRVLLLSPYPEAIIETIQEADECVVYNDPPPLPQSDLVVSYGYRHIIREFPLTPATRMVNLHLGYLPWGRGADPNFWSWVEGSPKGVTIHVIDPGIDAGPILVQERTEMSDDETLATSYWKLRKHMELVFWAAWPWVRAGSLKPVPQSGSGSFHRAREFAAIFPKLPLGYDTPVSRLRLECLKDVATRGDIPRRE